MIQVVLGTLLNQLDMSIISVHCSMAATPSASARFVILLACKDAKWISQGIRDLGGEVVDPNSNEADYYIKSSSDAWKKFRTTPPPTEKVLMKKEILNFLAKESLPVPIAALSSDLNRNPHLDHKSSTNLIEIAGRKVEAKRKREDQIDDLSLPPSKAIKKSEPESDSSSNSLTSFMNISAPSKSSKDTVQVLRIPVSLTNSGLKWKQQGSLYIYSSPTLRGSSKIAAFDMDGTLIQPKGKSKFPTDRKDWVWLWSPQNKIIQQSLQELHTKGYHIVIFSNQAGISKGNQNASDLTGKVEDMCANIDVPITTLLASANDTYRKPSASMWNYFVKNLNGGIEVDYEASFYIGDAAGRNANWSPGKVKDHGVVDRKFAHNCGLPFKTPEEYFLNQKSVDFVWRTINPGELLEKYELLQISDSSSSSGTANMPNLTNKNSSTKYPNEKANLDFAIFQSIISSINGNSKSMEMILMMGFPASGKSTFVKNYLVPKGYVRINRDELGTAAKCLSAAKAALAAGKSVAVDNTNPSATARAEYINLAKQFGVKSIRVFIMKTERELAEHCNLYRESLTNGSVKRIPTIAFHTYNSNLEQPQLSEGITDIVDVPWIPRFDNQDHKNLFLHWTE